MARQEESKGFCMFYDWVEDLSWLDGADAWEIVRALCGYYREGIDPVEAVDKHLRATVAMMFHQIKRQEAVSAKRAENAKATNEKRKEQRLRTQCERKADDLRTQCNATNTDTNTNTDTDTDTDTETDTETGTEYREAEASALPAPQDSFAPQPFPAPQDSFAPPMGTPSESAPRLSEEEKRKLLSEGIGEDYIKVREDRAALYAKRNGKSIYDILLSWWQEDRGRRSSGKTDQWRSCGGPSENGASYGDIDDFFTDALCHAFDDGDAPYFSFAKEK